MENFNTITSEEVTTGFINAETVSFEENFSRTDEVNAYADLYGIIFG